MAVSITAPTAAEVVSGVKLVTVSVSDSPHHVQIELSADGGLSWQRLCAKNRAAPYETNFNTWRFGNGSYQIRAREFSGSAASTVTAVSAAVVFTITNSAGTVRDCDLGSTTLASVIAASADGDTIRLTGSSTEGNITVNKRLKIIKNPLAPSTPVINVRLRWTADGILVDGIKLSASQSPLAEAKAGVLRNCEVTSNGAGIGIQEASTIPFDADGSFDTLIENCTIHHVGNRTTESNSAHGIYAQNSLRLFVTGTIFYQNAARQIQLYPQALQATIYKCALYDSEQAVNIGGDTSLGAGMDDGNPGRVFKTNYATIERCIVGKGGGLDGSSSDGLIYVNWANGVGAGTGNEVLENWMHDPPTAGFGAGHYIDTAAGGITDAGGNITGISPGYTNASGANFLLVARAAAIGYGPDSIQPTIDATVGAETSTAWANLMRESKLPSEEPGSDGGAARWSNLPSA